MIIGLLICAIGIIPLVLAFCVNRLYKESSLSFGLLLFMILITAWQESVGFLYFTKLDEHVSLLIFKLLKVASIYAIPVVFYIAYDIIRIYSVSFPNDTFLHRVLNRLFTKKILIGLFIWSTAVYTIIWTNLGVRGLREEKVSLSSEYFYFPVYGEWYGIYVFHMATVVIFLLFLFYIAKEMHNRSIRNFLRGFSIYSLLLFILALLNFNPATGIVAGSLGVILFSVLVIFEFIKLNTLMKINYFQLMERQKKMDYTGNLAASMIHEVKNTNTIIKGFARMLVNASSLNEVQKGSMDMIFKATEQIEELSNNYKEYIKYSKINFKIEDVGVIIQQAIEFSKEITNEKDVKVEFINNYESLKAYVNKAYFQQVFINLIKNSTEAISRNKKEKMIKIITGIENDNITIHFYDTGKGIPPANWDSIFDPFISFKSKGMGMGLPFVKKIIFEHLGDVRVIDSSPAGTHFKINIPQYVLHDAN